MNLKTELLEIYGCKDLADKLEIVRKNRNAVSEDELNNGKYRKAYLKLRHEVKDLLEDFVKWYVAGAYMYGSTEESRKKIIAYSAECFSLVDNRKLWAVCWKDLSIEGIIDTLRPASDKMADFYYKNQLCWI